MTTYKEQSWTGHMITYKQAVDAVGTPSNPSKMPNIALGSSATHCVTGSKLRHVEGSVCYACYALKGFYAMSPAINAGEIRYRKIMESKNNPQPWIDGCTRIILSKRGPDKNWMRWNDSGDLHGAWHIANIVQVALNTPNVSHWLPTREYKFVKDYIESGGIIPENLTIRISAHMVDQSAPDIYGLPKSEVRTTEDATCPSRFQDNSCGDCRKCWSKEVEVVSYYKH